MRAHRMTWSVLASGLAILFGTHGRGGEPCGVVAHKVLTGIPFEIKACETIHPLDIDVLDAIMQYDSCHLAGREKRTVVEYSTKEDLLNPFLRITQRGRTLQDFQVVPQTVLRPKHGSAQPTISCDDVGRFYFGHKVLGYVVGFVHHWPPSEYKDSAVPEVQELWRVDLPGFARVEEGDELREAIMAGASIDPMKLIGALDRYGSLVQQVESSGPYLVVEYRRGLEGFFHAFFHRSGRLVAAVGPWEAILLGPTAGGWLFATGGGKDIATFAPTEKVEVAVRDRALEALIDHATAWLTPRPINRDYALTDCLNRPVTELKYWLGDAFDPETARAARGALIRLGGGDWIASLEDHPAVRAVLRRFNPASRPWQADHRRALLEAGVDVAVVKAHFAAREAGPEPANPADAGTTEADSPKE